MARRAHIVGAGLAGLSAAVRLALDGWRVALYEAGPRAGGRCRSYFDETLGCRLDNGNHLLLSGNRSAMDYLGVIGSADSLAGPAVPRFPFVDLATGERWTLAPSAGRLPHWLFDRHRRVPGTGPADYLSALKFARAGAGDTVASLVGASRLFRRFWEPLSVAILNTEADQAAAALLWPVLKETFGAGGAACRPLVAREGLSESFIDPALAWLRLRGAVLSTGCRVRSLQRDGARVTALVAGTQPVELAPGDVVVLAVPPGGAAELLPSLVVPTEFRSIVNAHYRCAAGETEAIEIIGVVGGTAEWIFRRGGLVSVTVSAATRIVDRDADDLAGTLWRDVAAVLGLDGPMPPVRIVKEKRATFAQTPAQLRRRPPATTQFGNLFLAGDWTDTGLPATIEGSIRSGVTAAKCVRDAMA